MCTNCSEIKCIYTMASPENYTSQYSLKQVFKNK